MKALRLEDGEKIGFLDIEDDDIVIIYRSDTIIAPNGAFKYLGKWEDVRDEITEFVVKGTLEALRNG